MSVRTFALLFAVLFLGLAAGLSRQGAEDPIATLEYSLGPSVDTAPL